MAEPLHIRVEAGNHERRQSLVSFTLPMKIQRANLYREGRKRPIPCQLESTSQLQRLWWQVEDLSAGASLDYELIADDRQRDPSPRIKVSSTATGWLVAVGENKWAEILIPQVGPMTITLWSEGRRIANVRHLPQPSIATDDHNVNFTPASFHYFRIGDAAVEEGSVFGSLTTRHRVLSAEQRPAWRQTTAIRIAHGPAGGFMLDVDVKWIADAGPIRIGSPLAHCAAVSPSLDLSIMAESTESWTSIDGRSAEEVNRSTASGVFCRGAMTAIAVFADSKSFGFPNRWLIERKNHRTCASVVNNISPKSAFLLPLGSIASWRWRCIVGHATLLAEQQTERALDFDIPAIASVVATPKENEVATT